MVGVWGLATGICYGAIARTLDLRRDTNRRTGRAQDFYVLAWYGLAATGFAAAGFSAAIYLGADDVALLATLRLALVLTFVLAVAALLAAGAHAVTAMHDRNPKGDAKTPASPP